jgi:hypothetical protein
MPETVFTRALKKMSLAELRDVWRAEVEGRFDATLPPRERFTNWYRRQRNEAFLDRLDRLSVREKSAAWLRIIADEPLDEILPPPPASPMTPAVPKKEDDVNATHRTRSRRPPA